MVVIRRNSPSPVQPQWDREPQMLGSRFERREVSLQFGDQLIEPWIWVPHQPAAQVGLGWQMVAVADGTVAGGGYDVMVLDDSGRILLNHQHIAPS